MIEFTIPLTPITKKNHQRILVNGNRRFIAPSSQYKQYEKDCGYFLPHRGALIDKPCEITYSFFMPDRRRVDLTNLEEAIDDILVKYKVIKDDSSNIVVSHDGSRVLIDRDNPRTEVKIKLL